MSGFIIVIAGPTGVGESTVTKAVLAKMPRVVRLVTTTSRVKRPGEREGREYHFVTKKEFQRRIRQGYFLEYIYIRNRGVYYGTYRPTIEHALASGKILIANLELKGVRFMRRHYPRTHTIFIAPENIAQIRARKLQQHPTITIRELSQRLANAQAELREARYYDAVVVNREGHLSDTVRRVIALIRAYGRRIKNT